MSLEHIQALVDARQCHYQALEGNGGSGGNHPTFDILAPSRSNGDILQHIRAHAPTSNAVRGEDNGGRAGKRGREEIQERGSWSRFRHLMRQDNQGSWRMAKLGYWRRSCWKNLCRIIREGGWLADSMGGSNDLPSKAFRKGITLKDTIIACPGSPV
jgi:hypothetical protein